jgi:hypothetical protein
MRLLDRAMSVRLEKTDFLIVAHLHAVAAGRAGVVAYGFDLYSVLDLLDFEPDASTPVGRLRRRSQHFPAGWYRRGFRGVAPGASRP